MDDVKKDNIETVETIEKLEEAYKVFRISEIFLKDVCDDYGKQKIARLRYDFAKHKLKEAWHEASQLGVEWEDSDMMKNCFLAKKGNECI